MTLRRPGFAFLLALAAGCAPAPRAPADSVEALSSDEVLLVGRVELVPALRKGEQRIGGNVIGGSSFVDRLLLIIDDKPRKLPRDLKIADYAGRIEAPLGQTFFVRSRAAPFYILGGVVVLEMGGSGPDYAHFPGGLRVDVKPGDRAVYIGTLRYHRDEFFEVTKVVVVDDYAEASPEFVRKFGDRHGLRKSLMKRN